MIELTKDGPDLSTVKEPYLLDFWAEYCAPCRQVAPILEQLSTDLNIPVYKVDIEDREDLAALYDIRAIPTVVKVVNGQEVGRLLGSQPMAKYIALVNG